MKVSKSSATSFRGKGFCFFGLCGRRSNPNTSAFPTATLKMKPFSAFSSTLMMTGVLCLALSTMIAVSRASCQAGEGKNSKMLPKSGERVPLDADHYFVYGFDKAPKLGTNVI